MEAEAEAEVQRKGKVSSRRGAEIKGIMGGGSGSGSGSGNGGANEAAGSGSIAGSEAEGVGRGNEYSRRKGEIRSSKKVGRKTSEEIARGSK